MTQSLCIRTCICINRKKWCCMYKLSLYIINAFHLLWLYFSIAARAVYVLSFSFSNNNDIVNWHTYCATNKGVAIALRTCSTFNDLFYRSVWFWTERRRARVCMCVCTMSSRRIIKLGNKPKSVLSAFLLSWGKGALRRHRNSIRQKSPSLPRDRASLVN